MDSPETVKKDGHLHAIMNIQLHGFTSHLVLAMCRGQASFVDWAA